MNDPFYAVKEDVQVALNSSLSLFERWKTLVNSSNTPERQADLESTRSQLLLNLNDLEEDTRALGETVATVEAKPGLRKKFGIEDVELVQRKRFVNDVKARIESIKKALNNPALSAPAPSRGKQRKELIGDRYSKLDDEIVRDNDEFLAGETQRQQQIMREQDQDVEVIGAGVQRLKEISVEVSNELDMQKRILDDIDEKADNLGSKMERLQAKIQKLINNKDSGKICAIFCLMIVLVVVAVFVFYQPGGKKKKA